MATQLDLDYHYAPIGRQVKRLQLAKGAATRRQDFTLRVRSQLAAMFCIAHSGRAIYAYGLQRGYRLGL